MGTHRIGCLVVGIGWAALFMFTFFGAALGHQQEGAIRWFEYILIGELVLLVAIGWFFYRREMKDGDF